MSKLDDWQVSALLSMAAAGQCPCCERMHGEWVEQDHDRQLFGALHDAGCTWGRGVTPLSVLRALERAGLA